MKGGQMSCYSHKKYIIEGDVLDDVEDGSDIRKVTAELELVCAKYGLRLTEE